MRLLLLSLLLCACTADHLVAPVGFSRAPRPGTGTYGPGAYAYTANDSNGVALVKGTLTFTRLDSAGAEGIWEFGPTGHHGTTGPQVGTGAFVGGFSGVVLRLSLNPTYVDNNVLLTGTFTGGVYSGTWTYNSFIGNTAWGAFRADPIRSAR